MDDQVLDWLLDGDPAVRWQVERDILGLEPATWGQTRKQCVEEGLVRRLVDLQDSDGTWGGGLYSPKWTSTTYSLLLLRRLGLEPGSAAALGGCAVLLDRARWLDGGLTYWKTHTYAEKCVNGMVLSVGAYFGLDDQRLDRIAESLAHDRMGDGGWNCLDHEGATHSSMHTTISVLEGLSSWQERHDDPDVANALRSGEDFLLAHRLFRSHRTGEVVDPGWLAPHFPPRWHYDVLRGADHFRRIDRWDRRLEDGIDVIGSQRTSTGRWPRGPSYGGQTFFPLEDSSRGGRFNTLRGLRVLEWADRSR